MKYAKYLSKIGTYILANTKSTSLIIVILVTLCTVLLTKQATLGNSVNKATTIHTITNQTKKTSPHPQVLSTQANNINTATENDTKRPAVSWSIVQPTASTTTIQPTTTKAEEIIQPTSSPQTETMQPSISPIVITTEPTIQQTQAPSNSITIEPNSPSFTLGCHPVSCKNGEMCPMIMVCDQQ